MKVMDVFTIGVGSFSFNENLKELQKYSYKLKKKSKGRILSNQGGWQSVDTKEIIKETTSVMLKIDEAVQEYSELFKFNFSAFF